MPIFNGLLEPKKSAVKDGAVPLAIAIEAPNKKVAESIIFGKLWECYPANGDNYFKAKVWEDAPGQPRSAVGKFDEQFAQENTFDGEKWVANNVADTGDATLPDTDEIIDLMKLPAQERFAAVLLFSTAQIDGQIYSQVLDYLNNLEDHDVALEDNDRLNFNVLCALHSNAPVKEMHVEGLNNLIQGIFSHFENQTPGKHAISQFIKRWLENHKKRDELAAPANNASSTEPGNSAHSEPESVVSQKRGYKHTYETLDQEIALALLPFSADSVVLSGNLRDAEKIIADDREDFKRWSMALRTTEHILEYDRPTIFGVIQNVPSPDTYHFPVSLNTYINKWLSEHGRLENDGEFNVGYTSTISKSQETSTASTQDAGRPEYEEAQHSEVSEQQAQIARETLNKMGMGVYATEPAKADTHQVKQEEQLSDKAQHLPSAAELLANKIAQEDEARSRVDEVEKSLSSGGVTENLSLWKRVFKTDERFTKGFTQNGGGTSINGTYMTMLATREFGPKGIGWGVEILEERFDDGAPIVRKMKGADGNQTWELIPDGAGGYLKEKNHVIKILLWYFQDGKRGEEVSFGCTPYLYDSKYGPICDGEASKKSLTDATKKALSSLGFSADIFMGLYDNAEYRQKNKEEFALKNASESAEDAARLRQELDDKLTRVANTLATGVSDNELGKIYSAIAREVEVHRKDAEAKGDTQHARYLSGRLRRLTSIKDSRLAELKKAQEKA